MPEERPSRAGGGSGGVLVPEIPPNAPKPAASAAIPPTMVLGYVDLAIRGVLEYDRFSHAYLSPWWAVDDVPEGTFAWKRAVLERVPLRGALHWGHLFLVVSDAPTSRGGPRLFRSEPLSSEVGPRAGERRWRLRDGRQIAELVVHASRADRADRLVDFAKEVEERFRRQMD